MLGRDREVSHMSGVRDENAAYRDAYLAEYKAALIAGNAQRAAACAVELKRLGADLPENTADKPDAEPEKRAAEATPKRRGRPPKTQVSQ